MEIPLADAGIGRLQNSISGSPLLRWLPEVSDLVGVWASIALTLATFVALVSLAWRTRFVILHYRSGKLLTPHPTTTYSSDNDSSSDDGSDTDELQDDVELSSSEDELGDSGNGRGQDGNFMELGRGGAVVKTWEGLGLGFDRPGGLISLLDLDRGEVLRSYTVAARAGEIPSVAGLASPAVVVSSAGSGEAVRVWDARVESQIPAAASEWRRRGARQRRRVVRIAAGDGGKRVFFGDDDGAVAVADLRSGRSPVTETWWDADAVIVDDGDATGGGRGGSVVSWCRNAVRCLPLLPSPK